MIYVINCTDALFQQKNALYEEQFKAATIGLVTAEQFKQKRLEIENLRRKEEEVEIEKKQKERRKKEKERKQKLSSLSFDCEDDEEQQTNDSSNNSNNNNKRSKSDDAGEEEKKENNNNNNESSPPTKKSKIDISTSKDPSVDTSFLPDRHRELAEQQLREQLKREWMEQQEKMKKEQIEITYSYWDGSGHRNKLIITKGSSIGQFLEKARKDLSHEFHELRGCTTDQLIYVKEDLIIPQHFTFYDLIITKARGKSGPLFHFDVHDDIRLTIDSKLEKDESHAGKIVTKAYYERNKHIFPASRWEIYDPAKKWDSYTIK